MTQVLVNVTPFKSILRESKERPGVFEVQGILQRAGAKNQNGRVYDKTLLEICLNVYSIVTTLVMIPPIHILSAYVFSQSH